MNDRDHPIRVLHLVWRLSPSGGIPSVVRHVLSGTDRARFTHLVCSLRPLEAADRLSDVGDDVQFVSLNLRGAPSLFRRAFSSLRLKSVVCRLRPHVLHTHSGVAWYLLPWLIKGGRCPLVLEVHDSPQSSRVSSLNNRIERWMLARPGVHALVHSGSVRADLAAYTRKPPSLIDVIPIGIHIADPVAPSSGDGWRRSRGIAPNELVVTYVARLVESKRADLFARVAAAVAKEHQGVRFVLVGEGPERSRVEDMVAASGLADRLLLTGWEEDLAAVLAGSDIFLSTSDYEGFGMAILEAMAASRPVVSTAVGGTGDLVVPHETGLVAAAGDVEGLARHVNALIEDPALRARLGANGRARAVEQFDRRKMLLGYERLYERVVGAGLRRAH